MTARELQRLPGIGPRMAEDLERLGVRSVKTVARRGGRIRIRCY